MSRSAWVCTLASVTPLVRSFVCVRSFIRPNWLIHLLCRDYNCDYTTIRLRYDYDASRAPASIRREQEMNMSIFRIVVVSQSNRTHIVISITFVVVECVVVSSYRSRVVESQLWYKLYLQFSRCLPRQWRYLYMSNLYSTTVFQDTQFTQFTCYFNLNAIKFRQFTCCVSWHTIYPAILI